MTVDCTDFLVQEPWPFVKAHNKKWYTKKFNHAGLRYELGINIQTGDICWVNGPFRCGQWSDLRIFRRNLKHMLGLYERVETNDGYAGEPKIRNKSAVINWIDYEQKALARARHESINRRPKQFGCMKQEFCHTHLQHNQCFGAILVLIQIDIEMGKGPFQVEYY